MSNAYDLLRSDAQKLYHVACESYDLKGVPPETIELMRDLLLEHADKLEQEERDCACCGCGGCMKRPSGLVGDPQ